MILTGFMGAGKTSVARRVAERLGWEAVDLDDWIEASSGKKISEIFETCGEDRFRDLETEALATLAVRDKLVLATGGGTLLRQANRDLMAGLPVVNLSADFETLHQRICRTGHVRPLVRLGKERLRELFEARKPFYQGVGRQIDTKGKTPDQVAEEVLALPEIGGGSR